MSSAWLLSARAVQVINQGVEPSVCAALCCLVCSDPKFRIRTRRHPGPRNRVSAPLTLLAIASLGQPWPVLGALTRTVSV